MWMTAFFFLHYPQHPSHTASALETLIQGHIEHVQTHPNAVV